MNLRRRFLMVGDRRVHYLRAGEGPPVVLVHSSPANAWLLMKEINHLSSEYTVFAFDTPGFGLSDALPLAEMKVADLADALADTLNAIGMPPCPMFGTHTGAAIALEFGVRHPQRVTGLVLDGVPAFTEAECAAYFKDYFRALAVDDLGGQYAKVWTRFRDQSIWFPWCERVPENLNPYDLGTPESTHLWVSMYFEAADKYAPAYKAASYYGSRAIEAAAALNTPAIFTATDTDMLFPHLQRLPPLKPNQEIRHIGKSYAAKRALISEGFKRFGSPHAAPADRNQIASSSAMARQFIDGGEGRQVHLRYAGDRANPVMLLVHDAPGSAAQFEDVIADLSAEYFVIAPDLPGNGESDRFASDSPGIDDFARALAEVLDAAGIETADVYGIGFGASAALAFATRYPERAGKLVVRTIALPTQEEKEALSARLAPSIEIDRYGGHWYRTWLMLRDSKVYWPWYDTRMDALRRVPADFDAERLHHWTMDVMRRRDSYHHLIVAALAYDAQAALANLTTPPVMVRDELAALSIYDEKLAAIFTDDPPMPEEHSLMTKLNF